MCVKEVSLPEGTRRGELEQRTHGGCAIRLRTSPWDRMAHTWSQVTVPMDILHVLKAGIV